MTWEKYRTTMKSRSSELLVSGLYAVSFVLVGAPYETTFTASCILTLNAGRPSLHPACPGVRL
jgi:hypothetical protein